MVDVLVIGAGVVGGMIARELIGYTSSVVIAEAREDVALGATRANSAIVHAGFDAKEGSLKALLNVRGSKMMKKTAEELGVKYKNNGSLVVGFSDEDRSTLEELKIRGEKNFHTNCICRKPPSNPTRVRFTTSLASARARSFTHSS